MKAIHTKYLPASATKGSRIKAYTAKGEFSATISYPHELNDVMCHFEAVKALVKKHKLVWDISNMRHGDTADGLGCVFCFDASKVSA